jgi:hypothetical protein
MEAMTTSSSPSFATFEGTNSLLSFNFGTHRPSAVPARTFVYRSPLESYDGRSKNQNFSNYRRKSRNQRRRSQERPSSCAPQGVRHSTSRTPIPCSHSSSVCPCRDTYRPTSPSWFDDGETLGPTSCSTSHSATSSSQREFLVRTKL